MAEPKECPTCEGSGEVFDAYWTCGDPECCGSGRGDCPQCGGAGTVEADDDKPATTPDDRGATA